MELIIHLSDAGQNKFAIEMANIEATQINKPILVYDGDCDFCQYWISRWKHITKDRIDYLPYQEIYSDFPEIPISEFQSSVKLILHTGQVYSGAEAILRALNNSVLLWCYTNFPGFSYVTKAVYRFVAKHRQHFSKMTQRLWKKHQD